MKALAETLISTMEELSTLLSEETHLARNDSVRAIQALTERKQGLARGYSEAARTWRLTPDAAQQIDPETLELLRETTERYQALLEENSTALQARSHVTQLTVDTLVTFRRMEASAGAGYEASRSRQGTGGTYRQPSVTSATLNQTF